MSYKLPIVMEYTFKCITLYLYDPKFLLFIFSVLVNISSNYLFVSLHCRDVTECDQIKTSGDNFCYCLFYNIYSFSKFQY